MEDVFEQWMKEGMIPKDNVEEALSMLDEETKQIDSLVQQGEYWKAYGELMTFVALFNATAQQQPAKQPKIIQRLLDWIKKIKNVIDGIVNGIRGNGYSIGVSLPWGVSISVSFLVTPSTTP